MTKIKICGLSRECDIEAANALMPDYIGFVFYKKSKRYVSPEKAFALKNNLSPAVKAVGVFVDEPIESIAKFLEKNCMDIVQLHGNEDEKYIQKLRCITDKPIIKAFCINNEENVIEANKSTADFVLLDAGMGSGNVFDWHCIDKINRPYFLAGGLSAENAEQAIKTLHPFALDVSSGVETGGFKDKNKMELFIKAVRKDITNE